LPRNVPVAGVEKMTRLLPQVAWLERLDTGPTNSRLPSAGRPKEPWWRTRNAPWSHATTPARQRPPVQVWFFSLSRRPSRATSQRVPAAPRSHGLRQRPGARFSDRARWGITGTAGEGTLRRNSPDGPLRKSSASAHHGVGAGRRVTVALRPVSRHAPPARRWTAAAREHPSFAGAALPPRDATRNPPESGLPLQPSRRGLDRPARL
jgi:hypothetical protein